LDYQQTLATIERSISEQALKRTGGNKKAAAVMLGLKRETLSPKVRNMEALERVAEKTGQFPLLACSAQRHKAGIEQRQATSMLEI
jgi:hypothetical protein